MKPLASLAFVPSPMRTDCIRHNGTHHSIGINEADEGRVRICPFEHHLLHIVPPSHDFARRCARVRGMGHQDI